MRYASVPYIYVAISLKYTCYLQCTICTYQIYTNIFYLLNFYVFFLSLTDRNFNQIHMGAKSEFGV